MVATLEDCKSLCANFQGCVGIEYNAGGQRCEIWTRPEGIEVTKEAAGYVCLKYLPNVRGLGLRGFDSLEFRGFILACFAITWNVQEVLKCFAPP